MFIELTRVTRSGNFKTKINPLNIVLMRETREGEVGNTKIELLNSAGNQNELRVKGSMEEIEEKVNGSSVVQGRSSFKG